MITYLLLHGYATYAVGAMMFYGLARIEPTIVLGAFWLFLAFGCAIAALSFCATLLMVTGAPQIERS